MDDFLPYFTKDGSVGLYSSEYNDIYHSVLGAYTEAYEKFILPANFNQFLNNNREIKILDICYGIGYNSKSFLNYYLENISKEKNDEFINKNKYIYQIHTNNKIDTNNKYNLAIDTYNICDKNNKLDRNEDNVLNNTNEKNQVTNNNYFSTELNNKYIYKKYFDKLLDIFENFSACKKNILLKKTFKFPERNKYSIKIDAFDINENFIKLSPFIKIENNKAKIKLTGIEKIDKYLNKGSQRVKRKYKYNKDVDLIILINLLNQYGEQFKNNELEKLIHNKKYKKIFNINLWEFIKFYNFNEGKFIPNGNKIPFLHNI